MLYNIIKKIPFIIPILAMVNLIIIKISEFTDIASLKRIIRMQFINNSPIYFNYWIIYISITAITSIILSIMKKYTWKESVICIILNSVAFVMVGSFIITRM